MCPELFQQVADAIFEFPRHDEPAKGINFSFSYCFPESAWLDLKNLVIPGLRKELQPEVLNKQFHRVWVATLGKREPSWRRVRILGDQSTSPLSVLFRIMSRFIDLCLSALPARCHWDKTTHGAFISELEVDAEGKKSPNASWSQKTKRAWIQVILDDVEPVLYVALKFMQVLYGKTKGRQIRGVMIGSNLGSALFRMVLICHETHALLPRRWEGFLARHCP